MENVDENKEMPETQLKIAITCSSNMNRSMEAHSVLKRKGFLVYSFGTGDKVRLPGPSINKPNVYDFTCTYNEIYEDLCHKDKSFYTKNGLLNLLERNKKIKLKPEQFQNSKEEFDVVITCEERIYYQVVEFFIAKEIVSFKPVHIINIDIIDNLEEAIVGAFVIYELVSMISKCKDIDNELVDLLPQYEKKLNHRFLHCMRYY